MKQSLQYHLPKLHPAVTFSEFMQQQRRGQLLIAHCEEGQKELLKNIVEPKTNTTILIGPEGDFSNKEIKIALDVGYIPITLGSTRLRTETAAISAVHSIAFINA